MMMKHSPKPDSMMAETTPPESKALQKKEPNQRLPFYVLAENFIVTFLLTAALLVLAALLAFKLFHINAYTILTGSMTPAYPVNSLVFSRLTDCQEIKEGDVITFAVSESTCVTHRVVSVDTKNRRFITKGDSNEAVDSHPVLWDNVLGKVVFMLPFGGEQFRWLTDENNRTTVFVIMGIALGLILVWDIISTVLKRRRKKKQSGAFEAAQGTEQNPAVPPKPEETTEEQ